ncbi:hypothetical protein [Acinetobacter bereziniae]|uniref:hypothetical protein n=1 Tax=Acinetobacter bereziniae TaxID=106648 RepID=UPI00124FDD9B|nr:hypothetical protein [Acinetobacter bereziniae]
MNKNRKGTIAIRPATQHQEPYVVYVGGVNSFDMLICRVINSSSIVFSGPEDDDLLDFDVNVYEKLKKDWRLANLRKQVADLEAERHG